jgi:hypothetical protein
VDENTRRHGLPISLQIGPLPALIAAFQRRFSPVKYSGLRLQAHEESWLLLNSLAQK